MIEFTDKEKNHLIAAGVGLLIGCLGCCCCPQCCKNIFKK
jgi:hypothetical protein